MSDGGGAVVHISSAVVRCRAEHAAEVAGRIDGLDGAEVAHVEGSILVVILEGPTSGSVGSRLAEISLLEGVISAAMVYEQVEPAETLGEEA